MLTSIQGLGLAGQDAGLGRQQIETSPTVWGLGFLGLGFRVDSYWFRGSWNVGRLRVFWAERFLNTQHEPKHQARSP